MKKLRFIARDVSWLSFNARVLQEAADPTVPIKERIKFLGIVSNNLDEFFRVRVATLKRLAEVKNQNVSFTDFDPDKVLEEIQQIVLTQQKKFEIVWNDISRELKKQKIFLLNDKQLNSQQRKVVVDYFNEEVRTNIVPLMIENIHVFPYLNDKSIYLACKLSKADNSIPQKFALVPVPSRRLSRFFILPSKPGEHNIILLEDVIRLCLPNIFSFFGYDVFSAHIIKVTRDAEIDIDNDVSTSIIQKIEKGIKNRKKGKPVRFVFDKEIDSALLTYLIKRLGLSHKDNLSPGGRIHNFKDFVDFPQSVFQQKNLRKNPFIHPAFRNTQRITDIIFQKDVLLNFPYHSFDSLTDFLREAAFDPDVTEIKITCYRLAPRSKIINALTNASRNGKKVTVLIELKARFDEEANLEWKEILEEEGVKVLIGFTNLKVHAKLCLIKKRVNNKTIQYGFVSTGNLNERTAKIYADHCLLTANRSIMADMNRIFNYLELPNRSRLEQLRQCKQLIPCPIGLRNELGRMIQKEIKAAQSKKEAGIIIKTNSLSDYALINKLYEAAQAGVEIKLIVRGICCMLTENKKFKKTIQAISIVDEYLEHARIFVFHNDGKEKVFISSADWMVRNLDHRVEATCPILSKKIRNEIKDILQIQLSDNNKARILNNELSNQYVTTRFKRKVRSQVEIYNYLFKKLSTKPAE